MKENSNLTFQVLEQHINQRLDAFLSENIQNRSRSRLQKVIDEGGVAVNGKQEKSSYKLRTGDKLEVTLNDTPINNFKAEDISLEVVYEDEFLAVVNKASGMVVHPGAGTANGTLANALAFKFNVSDDDLEMSGEADAPDAFQNIKAKIGIVHRLDKDTSGLIVVAKTEEIHEQLSEQFKKREVFKSYIALVHGEMEKGEGEIDAPIAREKHNRTKMAVRTHGRRALSLYRVKKRFDKFTLVAVEIKTGRTHQIRVHLASINHPIVGDETYNSGRDKTVRDLNIRQAIVDLNRFFLHAEKLSFTHPKTGEQLNFTQPLPVELTDFLHLLGD